MTADSSPDPAPAGESVPRSAPESASESAPGAVSGPPPSVRLDAWGPRAWRDDLIAGALLLTRLPLAWRGPWPEGLALRAMRAWPLVGAAVGLAGGLAAALAAALGLPALLVGLAAVAVAVALTGGLHEDGLADLADGLGGGRDRAAKLAIMRDSRIGSYGVIALVLGLGARAAAIGAIAAAGPLAALGALVAAGAASRAVLPVMLRRMPPARPDGLGRGAGRPTAAIEATAVALGALLAILGGLAGAAVGADAEAGGGGPGVAAVWLSGPVALAAGAMAAAGIALLARRQLGGQTGDVLGATQQTAEIAMLLAFAAVAAPG